MAPSPFISEWVARLGPHSRIDARTSNDERPARRTTNHERQPRALDVAMGRGRHTLVLARAGFKTFGVDIKLDIVGDAVRSAAAEGLIVRGWCADLTRDALPVERFDLIVVTRYLQRDLLPSLGRALMPGGMLLYETFTLAQRALGRGPTSPDHLLESGELRKHFEGFDVLFYEEVSKPDAVARIVVKRT